MKRYALSFLAAALLVAASPLSQSGAPADETRIALRDEFLQLINRDRTMHGLRPLKLDPAASAIADSYCASQIRNHTTGHYTIDGLSPYMRYSFAGGNDGLTENAAAWSAAYRFDDRSLFDMVQKSERAMLAESGPHDGHRRAILDPTATHVGIGLAWQEGEFRLTQEFIRRYVDWIRPFPREAFEDDNVIGGGRALQGYSIEAISVHYEPPPRPLAVTVVNSLASYALPDKRHDYLPRLRSYRERRGDTLYEIHEEYADGSHGDFPVASDGGFTFRVPLTDGPGIYTVVIWAKPSTGGAPIPASNVSIRVSRRPGAPGTYAYGATR